MSLYHQHHIWKCDQKHGIFYIPCDELSSNIVCVECTMTDATQSTSRNTSKKNKNTSVWTMGQKLHELHKHLISYLVRIRSS